MPNHILVVNQKPYAQGQDEVLKQAKLLKYHMQVAQAQHNMATLNRSQLIESILLSNSPAQQE